MPQITEAESVVMEALWVRSPRTAEDIAAEVVKVRGWSTPTVKTLINRLLKKHAIAAAADGRRYLYSPLVERADYVLAEGRSLVDRLFDGRLAPLVSHFSDAGHLSADDLADLKRLIEALDQ